MCTLLLSSAFRYTTTAYPHLEASQYRVIAFALYMCLWGNNDVGCDGYAIGKAPHAIFPNLLEFLWEKAHPIPICFSKVVEIIPWALQYLQAPTYYVEKLSYIIAACLFSQYFLHRKQGDY